MPRIASSATSVLIGHIADHTGTIRVGAGGIMLPNHAPLTIAEQFGTLASLHPGRVDLGLGRAPGSDRATMAALRRGPEAADRFPEDVLELQGYLSDESRMPGVHATPGRGTNVPLYILGSSLFGAQLAALLGLPFAFASHFAPAALEQAVSLYRRGFRPSAQQEHPHVIAALNVIVAHDAEVAAAELRTTLRRRAVWLVARGRPLTDDEADALLASPAGAHVRQMLTYSAVGTPAAAVDALAAFTAHAEADEVIVALQSPTHEGRVRSLELLAAAVATGGAQQADAAGKGIAGVGAPVTAPAARGGGAPERISAVTLITADMARATSFYEALGFVRSSGGPGSDFTSYRVGGGSLNLQADPNHRPATGWGRVIVWVDDVDAVHRRALAAGITPTSAPESAPWGERDFHLRDPDGHELTFATTLCGRRGAVAAPPPDVAAPPPARVLLGAPTTRGALRTSSAGA
jgi:luciferase family oxidoreductase group 1